MPTKTEIIDLIDHDELLLMFRDYVDKCVENSTLSRKIHPLSFDEWYVYDYDRWSQSVVTFDLLWEGAAGGYLTGTNGPESFDVRIPEGIVTVDACGEGRDRIIFDEDALRRLARKFARKMNRRLPTVLFKGERVYHWTW